MTRTKKKAPWQDEMAKRYEILASCRKALKRAPKPDNDAELRLLTQWYFGAPLNLSRLSIFGKSVSYEIEQKYNDYHGDGWLFGKNCIVGYDHSSIFWRHVFGPLSCGGIATHSYGQANIIGYRQQVRLTRWEKSRRKRGAGRIRSAFVRLARGVGAGENRISAEGSVLIVGREDGATGASFGQAT